MTTDTDTPFGIASWTDNENFAIILLRTTRAAEEALKDISAAEVTVICFLVLIGAV